MAQTSNNTRIYEAAMKIAAAQGWGSVNLAAVGKAAKAQMAGFKSPNDLIGLIADEIDRDAFAGKVTGTAHDKLFELLMARFDILQKNRKAILSMADAARQDRVLGCVLARATGDGTYRLIDAAGIDVLPAPRLVVALALGAVYGWAFMAWRKDNSRDMSKTMAALDRSLRWAGKAAEFAVKRKSSRVKA